MYYHVLHLFGNLHAPASLRLQTASALVGPKFTLHFSPKRGLCSFLVPLVTNHVLFLLLLNAISTRASMPSSTSTCHGGNRVKNDTLVKSLRLAMATESRCNRKVRSHRVVFDEEWWRFDTSASLRHLESYMWSERMILQNCLTLWCWPRHKQHQSEFQAACTLIW